MNLRVVAWRRHRSARRVAVITALSAATLMSPGPAFSSDRTIVNAGELGDPVTAPVDPGCVLAGVSERCPSWAALYDGVDEDECWNDFGGQVVGRDTVYLIGRGCGQGQEIVTVAFSLGDGSLRWKAVRTGGDINLGYDIALSPDLRTVYVVGSVARWPDPSDALILAYDAATGEERWRAEYDEPGHGDDVAMAVAVSGDGERVYVAGGTPNPGSATHRPSYDFLTMSLVAATGTIDWTATWDNAAHGYNWARGIAVRGQDIFVQGDATGGKAFDNDVATVAYRDDRGQHRGEILWTSVYDSGGVDVPSQVLPALQPGPIVATASTVFVGSTKAQEAFTECGTQRMTWTVLAYDRETGARRWVRSLAGPTGGQNVASALAAAPDGSAVYVTGSQSGPDDECETDATTVALDGATGAQRWRAIYRRQGEDSIGHDLALSPDGSRVYVGGSTNYWPLLGGRIDSLALAYDTTDGRQVWSGRYNAASPAPAFGNRDHAYDIGVSTDGSYLALGVQVYLPAQFMTQEALNDGMDIGSVVYEIS